jgi:short-subunit dehydrogenase
MSRGRLIRWISPPYKENIQWGFRTFILMLVAHDASKAGDKSMATLRPVALITGGSAGIGLAIARKFAAHGHDLLLIARDATRLEVAALALARDFPVSIHLLALDVTAADAVTRINRKLLASGLTVGWLVNNAGSWLPGAIGESRSEDLAAVLHTNIWAAHRLTRAVLPSMLQQGRGAILNVGSLAGMAPAPGFALYAASKAFLHQMTIALREELRGTGVTVSLLAPGVVRTAFIRGENDRGNLWLSWLQSSPETVARSAYCGLMSAQAVIVPGLAWRLVWLGVRILPTRITAWVLRLAQSTRPVAVAREAAIPAATSSSHNLSMPA